MSDVDNAENVGALSGQDTLQQQRKPRKSGDLKPCERCRSQHLKCVYSSARNDANCQRCDRTGHECIKSTKKIRFRDVSVFRLRHGRKAAGRTSTLKSGVSTGVGTAKPGKSSPTASIVLVDESAEHENAPTRSDEQYLQVAARPVSEVRSDADLAVQFHDFVDPAKVEPLRSTPRNRNDVQVQHSEARRSGTGLGLDLDAEAAASPVLSTPSKDCFTFGTWHDQPLHRILSSDRASNLSFGGSPSFRGHSASINRYLDQLVKQPFRAAQSTHEYTENVLLRYFREELACWFDLCDPDRHFATVVPQKAREPGPLRSAILTISARNLSRNKRFRNSAGLVEWRGCLLTDLKEEFAVPYHNECIRDLLQLSMDPQKLHDEVLLAAVLALRTDEEMGLNTEGDEEDQQLFLRIASVFIDAQLPPALALPHSSPEVFPSSLLADEVESAIQTSPSNHTEDLGANGLRQACFWTAFRQDLHAAFLKQQPVRFPLSRCEAFRQLSPATDAVWANRMVTFCADVLEFSYGSDSSDGQIMPAYTNHERWKELRDREQIICSILPATFEPTFCSEPGLLHGVFPEIWYLDPCHVSGTTYIELARMLLEVFNPTRPKLGHGFLAATNAFISSTKKILFRLCGIALSNHHCPPSLINACLGISMFGEYFEDPSEQDALLSVLELMQNRYAYPTGPIAHSLRRAWQGGELTPVDSYHPMDTG